jgi:hypothetical protein
MMRNSQGNVSLLRIDLSTREFKFVALGFKFLPNWGIDWDISADDRTAYIVVPGEDRPAPECRIDTIFAVDLESGKQRPVTAIPLPYDIIASPDNKTLYVTACDRTVLDADLRVSDSTPSDYEPISRRIVAVDVVTGKQSDVFNVKEPKSIYGLSVSPNGQAVATVVVEDAVPFWRQLLSDGGSDQGERLVRIGIDGSEKDLYVRPQGYILHPIWTLNGFILFNADGKRKNLMRIPSTGGDPEPLRVNAALPFDVSNAMPSGSVSPDGSHIVIRSPETKTSLKLWTLDNLVVSSKPAH